MKKEVEKFAKRRKLIKYSEEIITLIYEEKDIPFRLWVREGRYPRSNAIFCSFICEICSEKSRINTKHLAKRTLIKNEVCLKCGSSELYNREGWRKANSDAQKKIQSTPEQKKKNADGVSKFWRENPKTKERVRQKSLARYQDPVFKERWLRTLGKNFRSLSGKFKFRGRWIEFGSSYELCFLIWAENNNDIKNIRKCKFAIPYSYKNKIRHYLPDFLIEKNDLKTIVEIKGTEYRFYDNDKNNAKIIATKNFIQSMGIDSYWFIDEAESSLIGLDFKRTTKIKPICKRLYSAGKLTLFSKEKQKRYIGIRYEAEE